jgi:hypothetical protein
MPADDRPFDRTPVHTADLPETPTRDRNIAGSAWLEAPEALLTLGRDLGHPESAFKRRIHGWLLWRAGPARGAAARYLAVDPAQGDRSFTFELNPDGSGTGTGPSGERHHRFRTWKEDLRDHPAAVGADERRQTRR